MVACTPDSRCVRHSAENYRLSFLLLRSLLQQCTAVFLMYISISILYIPSIPSFQYDRYNKDICWHALWHNTDILYIAMYCTRARWIKCWSVPERQDWRGLRASARSDERIQSLQSEYHVNIWNQVVYMWYTISWFFGSLFWGESRQKSTVGPHQSSHFNATSFWGVWCGGKRMLNFGTIFYMWIDLTIIDLHFSHGHPR